VPAVLSQPSIKKRQGKDGKDIYFKRVFFVFKSTPEVVAILLFWCAFLNWPYFNIGPKFLYRSICLHAFLGGVNFC